MQRLVRRVDDMQTIRRSDCYRGSGEKNLFLECNLTLPVDNFDLKSIVVRAEVFGNNKLPWPKLVFVIYAEFRALRYAPVKVMEFNLEHWIFFARPRLV